MDPLTIAAVSCLIIHASPEANLRRIEHWTKKAAESGADLVLFNESSVPGYWYNVGFRKFGEPMDGPVMQRLAALAKENDIIVCAGIMEQDGDKVHNTQVLVGPDGLLGKHSKSSLPSGEEKWFDVGNDYNVVQIGPAKVGISICYESVAPDTCRKLRENGAEIILAPYSNGVDATEIAEGRREYFKLRAKENGVWYIACDQSAPKDYRQPHGPYRPGAVAFVNPMGEMVATTPLSETGESMIVQKIDLGLVAKARAAATATTN